MRIFYSFGVCDRLFRAVSEELALAQKNIQFSGIAYQRNEYTFNNNYDDVIYLSEIYPDESAVDSEYLKLCEDKYGIRIAELISAERHLKKVSKGYADSLIERTIKSIEKLYVKNPFDLIVLGGLADMPGFFLKSFAEKNNIPLFYQITNRMGSSVYRSNSLDTSPINFIRDFSLEKEAIKESPAEADRIESMVREYVANKSQPFYMTNSSLTLRYISFLDFKILAALLFNMFRSNESYHNIPSPFMAIAQRVRKIYWGWQYKSLIKKYSISFNKLLGGKYILYPLHLHPEGATLIQGRWINNQSVIIESIAKQLPYDVMLVVKEHKVSVGRRPYSFYKRILQIKNVKFISESSPVYDLIEGSLGVATISSSMGLEAIMMKKPLLSFGDIHYNYISDVIKAHDLSLMKDNIKKVLDFNGYDRNEFLAFFKVINSNTYDFSGFSPSDFDDKHVSTMARMISSYISSNEA